MSAHFPGEWGCAGEATKVAGGDDSLFVEPKQEAQQPPAPEKRPTPIPTTPSPYLFVEAAGICPMCGTSESTCEAPTWRCQGDKWKKLRASQGSCAFTCQDCAVAWLVLPDGLSYVIVI